MSPIRQFVTMVVVAASLLAARTAGAQESAPVKQEVDAESPAGARPPVREVNVPPPAPPAPILVMTIDKRPPIGHEWYGWQIIAVDLGTSILSVDGAVGNSPLILAFPVGAPLVHSLHGNYGPAVLSLGANLVFPLVGAMIAEEAVGGDGLVNLRGAMIGAGTAMLVDAVFLARKPVYERRPAEMRFRGVNAAPTVAASKHGVSLGLAGRF
ncbi:MAG TPA: hypothetical protein VL172_07840 [Kofleriaceae bacterium]|nr:hypothetical protein [Kofleriaceae bacterium]